MADLETLLLCVTKDYEIQVGLPPRNHKDSFKKRANIVGKVDQIRNLACSPDGEIFCVRSGDLYRGPLPSKKDLDWFTVARRVGKADWDKAARLFFHPDGDLYCVTIRGELYRGPQPDNENKPWFYDQATKIGKKGWEYYFKLGFDPAGNLYSIYNNRLYTGPPPTDKNPEFQKTMLGVQGWSRLTGFLGVTKDNKLWAVDEHNGNIYRGDIPTPENLMYIYKADIVGFGFNNYRFLTFTKDKTIHSVISFEFLVEEGEVTSEKPHHLQTEDYANKDSNTPLRRTFTLSESVMDSSTFSHEHGFTFGVGMETTVTAGIPKVAEEKVKITMNMSTTNNWKLTETNETTISYESVTNVEVPPGKTVKVKSSVMKAQMNIPYKMIVRTIFGAEVEIRGTWKGVSHYNLSVIQEDSDN
ncbi:tachylectin-2-like [Dendropsophus ebraccatus]|uniref:tachylectin-2-like n=1 Tax=Dendropsophus ebraccatus TaxID=150705 RepID=UPI003831C514